MTHRRFNTLAAILFIAAFSSAAANAQWLTYKHPDVPRLKDGKINMHAPAPRGPNGKPDLSGLWTHEITPVADFKKMLGDRYEIESQSALLGMELEVVHKYGINIFADMKPGENLTPAGEAAMKRRAANQRVENVCHGEYGWPVAGLLAEPMKFVQTPKETILLYEIDSLRREIYTDGRTFPPTWEFPAFLGYSIGRWDGNTFVVDTKGFNERTPLDAMGHPRTENMHVTERYRRPDFGHLESEVTFDDPEIYTHPFTVKINYTYLPDADIFEMFCSENEKDRVHMVK